MNRTIPSNRANVWIFFLSTYAASWLIWLPAILWRGPEPNLLLLVLGASVPSIMGIIFNYSTEDRQGRREFWSRVVDVRRIGWRWFIVIITLFPLAHGIAFLIYHLLGGFPPSLTEASRVLINPALLAQLIFANLVVSGFSEELGWRGYALDRLQQHWSALGASIILGFVHGLWHIPLFFIPGITQGEMGLFSLGAFVFLAGGPAGAILFTWVYNNTHRSILAAVLVHFLINLCLDLLVGLQGALPTGYSAVYIGILILFDVLIVMFWGARTLTGRDVRIPSRTSAVPHN